MTWSNATGLRAWGNFGLTTRRSSAASYKLLNPAQRAAVALALMALAA